MTDLATLTPAEIDTQLSRFYVEQAKFMHYLRGTLEAIEWERNHKHPVLYQIDQFREQEAKYRAKLEELTITAAPYHVEFTRRGGWNRYFLVMNANGHVHRGMSCATCYPTTEYVWLPSLSDCDESAMIQEYGEKACTVCFPNAPTNPAFHGPGRLNREAQEARAAERAAKQAAKDAKAITAPNGQPLRVDGNVIRTKVAAQRELSGAAQYLTWYGADHPSNFPEQIRVLSEALTAAGIDPAPIIARAKKKAEKDG